MRPVPPPPAAGVRGSGLGPSSRGEEELVGRFHDRVYHIALVRTRDPEAARDLAQETMLAVIRNLREGRLNDPEKLPAYVCGTVRNLVKVHGRTQRRWPEGGKGLEEVAVPSCEPEVERSERLRLAGRAIGGLRPADRLLLLLTLVDGLSPREIARRLGLRPEVVRMRKSRALERVREMVATGALP